MATQPTSTPSQPTQPTGTAPMALIDEVTGAYDEYCGDVFGIGKTAFDAKGAIPKKGGKWTNGYLGIDNFAVCCLSSKY